MWPEMGILEPGPLQKMLFIAVGFVVQRRLQMLKAPRITNVASSKQYRAQLPTEAFHFRLDSHPTHNLKVQSRCDAIKRVQHMQACLPGRGYWALKGRQWDPCFRPDMEIQDLISQSCLTPHKASQDPDRTLWPFRGVLCPASGHMQSTKASSN